MKIIFIYGAPSVGKLTVAKELSKLTKYPVLDNHLPIDSAARFFEYKSESFIKVHDSVRKIIFDELIKQNKNVIVSYCPTSWKTDNDFWKKTFKKLNSKVEIHFIRLECDFKEMLNRVVHEGRKNYGKVKTKKGLHAIKNSLITKPDKWKFNEDYLGMKTFVINNTELSAKKTALIIKKHCKID